MILHLGVLDQPYATAGGTTTGDVAGWLESKYAVMRTFAAVHEDGIAKALESSLQGAIDNTMMGAPPAMFPLGSASSAIEQMFREFLTAKELDGVAGIPTVASVRGVSTRFKRRRGPPRPSFIDSGLYESSFRAWVE